MKIFGEDYDFMLTIGGSAKIADLCPDGDLTRIAEVFEGTYSQTINFVAVFIETLAKGYDDDRRFSGGNITHKPLTAEMVKALPSSAFKEVQSAALLAFQRDMEATVEVAPAKKKESQAELK